MVAVITIECVGGGPLDGERIRDTGQAEYCISGGVYHREVARRQFFKDKNGAEWTATTYHMWWHPESSRG